MGESERPNDALIPTKEPFLWGDVDLRNCEYSGWNSCNITCNTVS